jgi:RNA polymerase sigma factor (sigma-70 family)
VNRGRDSETPGEIGFELQPVLETGGEGLLAGLAAGEVVEELPVAPFRGPQVGQELGDLGIVHDLQETGEALAAPRLDDRAEQQAVDLRPGLAADDDPRPQALGPGVLPAASERPAPPSQDRHHPPEVLHLLGRQRRGTLDELGVIRIVAGEGQGVHGDLLLADRVVGQELGQPRRRELRPRARRRVQQRKLGEDLVKAGRIGRVALCAVGTSHGPYNIRLPHSSTTKMKDAASLEPMPLEQDQRISKVVKLEQLRLRNFIRRRVPDPRDVEDILQDVFYELVEANRLLMPIEHVTSWLFRVARNRITDLFRRKRPESFTETAFADEDDERLNLEDLLPSPDAGPEALYARNVLLAELELAVDELPEEQREVFVAHELEGRSFKEMAAETGVNVNTLLSRKRYAVLHLRERLQSFYDEFRNP